MKFRASLLALVALLSIPSQQAQAVNGVQRAQLTNWIQNGRVAPPPATPPSTFTSTWQSTMSNAVKAVPADTFWQGFKKGNLTGVVNLAKTAGRHIGYGGAFQIGAMGINAALTAFYNRVKADANGTKSSLYSCLDYSAVYGIAYGNGLACGDAYNTTSLSFLRGEMPTYGQQFWWWDYRPAHNYWWRIVGTNGAFNSTRPVDRYEIQYSCGGKSDGVLTVDATQLTYYFDQYKKNCIPPQVTTKMSIPLEIYVEGGRVNSNPIVAQPKVIEELRDAIAEYYQSASPSSSPLETEIYPGVTYSIAPTVNQYYGDGVDSSEDLDGDGWSDQEELLRGSDAESADSRPDITRDTDGDGWTDGDEDRAKTSPYDSESKPGDLDGDKIPDASDPDKDGDGVPNESDPAPEDKTVPVACEPGSIRSSDGRSCLLDTDNDGTPNESDDDIDGDGVPNESDPEPENKDVPVKCSSGFVADSTGKTCVPEEDDEKCIDGHSFNAETQKCEPDTSKDAPVSDECGDISVKRFLAHTAHVVRDVIFPCESPKEIFKPLLEAAKTKYPFALVSGLNNMVSASGSASERAAVLPNKLGPFEFDWSWLSPLLLTVGLLFKGFTTWVAVDIVLSRLTGQLVIK